MNKAADLRRKLMAKTRKDVQEKFSGDESHLVKAIGLIQTLDEISNIMFEQVREWYALYFPELERKVKDPEAYLRLVYELTEKENFTQKKVGEFYKNEKVAAELETLAKNSVGAKASKETIAEIKLLSLNSLNLKEERKFLSNYAENIAKKIMPNFSVIAGGVLAGKMLAKAGSLKKLSMMPASTIQILGADKAIFAHIKSGAKSPKHGLLFQHPIVSSVPKKLKGKAAKLVAAKLTIAVKADYFSKENISEKLKQDLDKKVSALKGTK